jgi:diacylglycerol kinase family enzyme
VATPKKKILFIVNNLSGTVSQYNIPKCIDMFLDTDIYEANMLFIDAQMTEELYDAKLNGEWDMIVSVGGDGTLLELGQRLIDRNIPIAIVPVGSGNGIATHVGYTPRDIRAAFDTINAAKTKTIDVAQINDHYFFSNFGMGIDAKVAKDFKIKKKRSLFIYAFLTIRRVLKLKAKLIKYRLNDKEFEVSTYLFNVFNSNLYGYNIGILPWASAFDGELDVVYLKSVGFWRLPWASFCILIKKPQWSSAIEFFTTKEITILNFKNKKMGYQVDGDPKKSKREDLTIKILPNKLRLVVPC